MVRRAALQAWPKSAARRGALRRRAAAAVWRSARDGFSLVECVVAAVLLSIAVLSVGAGGAAALRMIARLEREQGALVAGAAVLDSLAQRPAPGSGTIARAPFRIDWDAVDTADALVRVRVIVRAAGAAPDSILALAVLALRPLPRGTP